MKLDHKQFIETFIIRDLEQVVKVAPYLSFTLMGSAITYLGGVITGNSTSDNSRNNFCAVVDRLFSFNNYLMGEHGTSLMGEFLYEHLCVSMGTSLMPIRGAEWKIGFDSGKNIPHSIDNENKYIVLQAETLYADIKNAALEVIAMMEEGKIDSEKISEVALTITE